MTILKPIFDNDQVNHSSNEDQPSLVKFSENVVVNEFGGIVSNQNSSSYEEYCYHSNTSKKIYNCGHKAVAFSRSEDCKCACFKHAMLHLYKRQRQIIIPFIWGILVGIAFTALIFQQRILMANSVSFSTNNPNIKFHNDYGISPMVLDLKNSEFAILNHEESKENIQDLTTVDTIKGFGAKNRLFVGVITANKFLGTRAVAVNNTWGNQVDKLEFYSQFGSPEKYRVPVVNLEHISDTEYPPQRKAFEMLKYMCHHHIDDYEWFIRADDDVYIRVEMLKKFLSKIDADRLIYMGQPGHGVPEMRGKLGLNGHNFCMGGPGVIFNRKTLKALCPHIDDCIKEVVSKEEDVELGRCVTNHLHIECTHAWEALKLFYHSYQEEYNEERPFLGNLVENDHVAPALTLHHIKLSPIMYKVHRHYNTLLMKSSSNELEVLRVKASEVGSHLQTTQQKKTSSSQTSAVVPPQQRRLQKISWQTFTTDSVYSLSPAHVMRDITNDVLADLKQVCETAIDTALDTLQVQKVTYSHVIDGSSRSDYQHGTDYHVDISFNQKSLATKNEIRRVHLFRPVASFQLSAIEQSSASVQDDQLIFVVVLVASSKLSEFGTFMRNFYEPVFLARGSLSNAHLIVSVDGKDEPNETQHWSLSPSIKEVLSWYKDRYPKAALEALPSLEMAQQNRGPSQSGFAQGVLHAQKSMEALGTKDYSNALVLLTTTNITLSANVTRACQLRTRSLFNNSFSDNNNYNFINYKARKKKFSRPPPQIYQPIPFHIYPAASVGPWPTAMVPQRSGLKPGTGSVPISMTKSSFGFWDVASATAGEENEVLAPLCGSLEDFRGPAAAAFRTLNSATADSNFQKLLYEQIYAGNLRILRSPDRSYGSLRGR